jgi:hypothetical protein
MEKTETTPKRISPQTARLDQLEQEVEKAKELLVHVHEEVARINKLLEAMTAVNEYFGRLYE